MGKYRFSFLIFFVAFFLGCASADTKTVGKNIPPRVILGDERMEEYLPLLKEKRVALFTNHSAILGDKIILQDGTVQYGGFTRENTVDDSVDPTLIPFGFDAKGNPVQYGEHVLDALISNGVNMAAVFSPEHGFRGTEDAGANIENSVDAKTGVPILSLYENDKTHAPSAENMAKFDVLLVDIQDVGLRYYTYYIALYYLMDACASAGKLVIILDRPNPNGFYVDGGMLQEKYVSGVGRLPVTTVHGMTLGELSLMMNGEGWLKSGKNACDLTVIPCRNYTHQTKYSLIRAPSPNIKDMRAVYLYASTCYFENTIVSVGRGTSFPFEVYGSPFFKESSGNDFSFTPQSIPGATNPPFLGEVCYGTDLRSVPIEEIWDAGINLSYLLDAYKSSKNSKTQDDFFGKTFKDGAYWIDFLSGSDFLRKQIAGGKSAAKIKKSWQGDINSFKKSRKKYLLYSEKKLSSSWQAEVSFPDWISNANFAANNSFPFRFFRGQGNIVVTVSDECESFSIYINGNRVNTKSLSAGGTYEIDISKFTKDGSNTIQVSDITPREISNAVLVQIPYPVVQSGTLKDSGISKDTFSIIEKIISADIKNGFTSAQLAVVKDGKLVYQNAWGNIITNDENGKVENAPKVTNDTLYDLASVTKMFSVNFAVQYLVTQKILEPDTKIVSILGDEFADDTISINFKGKEKIPLEKIKEWKRNLTIRDVICHTAGFAPGYPYYNDRYDIALDAFNAGKNKNSLFSGFDAGEETRKNTLVQIFRTPLVYEPHTQVVYSDIDFMLLCFVVEKVSGMRIDRFLRTTFWKPLNLTHITYKPLENGFSKEDCAATDPTGGSWTGKVSFTGRRSGVVHGHVHDANAYHAMAEISGHAGLFANATDLALLASVMLTGGYGSNSFFSRSVLDVFTAPQSLPFADYALGWWRQGEFKTVRNFGALSSSSSFGHQGFSGTLVFVEPEKNLVIVYLTNKINTPMVRGKELMNQFEGNSYLSAVPGFVPHIILMGLSGNVSKAQWKSFVGDMAEDARRVAQRDSGDDKNSTKWKAYESLKKVFSELNI